MANAVCRLSVGLAGIEGVEPTIVSYRRDAPPPWLPATVRIRHLGTGRARNSVAALTRYLRAEQPDVLISRIIHVNLLAVAASAAARVGSGWRGKLLLAHDHPVELTHSKADSKWFVKALYRFADGVIAPCPGVREGLMRWCGLQPDSVVVVPIPITAFTDRDEVPPHPWLAAGEPRVFITISNLVPLKRLELVVRAFARVRTVHAARLVIIGEGPERAALDRQIEALGLQEVAQTVGRVDDPRQFAARAIALVHASDEEGFAMVLTEAMSARCPVIAADAVGGGPRFVTGDGQFGMLVPRGDPASLSHSMERMLVPDIRDRYAELGLMRADVFSPASCARTLIDYVETLEQPVAARSTDDRFTGAGWWGGADLDL